MICNDAEKEKDNLNRRIEKRRFTTVIANFSHKVERPGLSLKQTT